LKVSPIHRGLDAGNLQSKGGEGLKGILQRAAGCTADGVIGVRCGAVKVVVVLCLEDEGSQPA